MIDPARTIRLLRLAINAELDRSTADALIDLCIRRTTYILHWTRKSNVHRFNKLGLRVEDVAYDIIAELVTDADGEYCAALCKALRSFPHESEDELLSSFEGLLFSNASMSLSFLYSEVNRTHYLMLRSLRYNAALQAHIATTDRLDGRWYLLNNEDDARLQLQGMPLEDLQQYLRGADLNRRPFMMALLNKILELLDQQDEFRKAVRESDIMQIAMDIIGTQYAGIIEMEEAANDEVDADVTLRRYERYLQRALELAKERNEEPHGNRKSLSPLDLAAFVDAAGRFVLDRLRGVSVTHYSYLRAAMPGLTSTRYREDYRYQFEYFIKKLLEDVGFYVERDHRQVPD